MLWKKTYLITLLLVALSSQVVLSSPQLFDWSEDNRQRKRSFKTVEETNSVETDKKLNVVDKDSPYALIDRFFSEREEEHQKRKNLFAERHLKGLEADPPSGLRPEEVWMSEGTLLVLKGGTSGDNYNGPDWEPLDDYVAPYREPKLPPPDFIPDDIGVGVPLEDEEELSNAISSFDRPPVVKSLKPLYDPYSNEEDFIYDMEHFHSSRKGGLKSPSIFKPLYVTPREIYVTTTPSGFAYTFSTTTAAAVTPADRDRYGISTRRPIYRRPSWIRRFPKPKEERNTYGNTYDTFSRKKYIEGILEKTRYHLNRFLPTRKESKSTRRPFAVFPSSRSPRTLDSGKRRKSGERYVTFFRGSSQGGKTWGYSYSLKKK